MLFRRATCNLRFVPYAISWCVHSDRDRGPYHLPLGMQGLHENSSPGKVAICPCGILGTSSSGGVICAARVDRS